MSVLIQKRDLFEIMQKAFPLIPAKSSLQILSNFKLTYTDSLFEISATDLDHSLKVTAKASGDAPFDITVNARKIFEIVRELPEGAVILDIDETVLLIESEKGFTCKIAGADSHDFPGFPQIDAINEFDIMTSKLRDMISKSAFAVSKDESRACLCGILWEIVSDRTGMVATDGHRLGSSFISSSFPITGNVSGILSQKSVTNLMRILDSKGHDESIKVALGEKYVSFSTPSLTMTSKLVDGQYPDYTKVIPRNNPKAAVVDRVGLLDAVRRVSVLSNQKNHLVKFVFKPGTLEIVVMNREIGGEARESLAVEYDGDEHMIGFNGQYFTEILDIIRTQKVKVEMNTQISACLVFPVYEEEKEKTSEDLFLIMPLRIMDEL